MSLTVEPVEPVEAKRSALFETAHLHADLHRRTLRGGAVTLAGQGARFVLNLTSTAILARLLVPQDFGLVAMVAAITGFLATFRDMGLSAATVQRREINHQQVSSLFWINVLVSLVVTLVTAAVAVPVANFYGDVRLVKITLALSLAALVTGLGVQHQALLARQMKFAVLSAIDLTSLAVGIFVAALLAQRGAGYWARVAMQLTVAITQSTALWVASSWRPGFMSWNSDVRAMLAFGGHLSGFNALNYIVRNFDNVLIGKFLGAVQLGIYSRAYQLLLLPLSQINGPISNVAVPVLSRLQNYPDRYRAYHRRMVMLVM